MKNHSHICRYAQQIHTQLREEHNTAIKLFTCNKLKLPVIGNYGLQLKFLAATKNVHIKLYIQTLMFMVVGVISIFGEQSAKID